MPTRQQLERALVRVGKAAPVGVRSRLGRATRGLRGRWQGPLVTVVVAVSDSETWRVAPCLESLRNQTHRNLDIRIAPFGPAERALVGAAAHAEDDWRIRIEPPAPDAASAWNRAAARSKAPYLVFVRGGDDVPRAALEHLVGDLEATGSDLAVGRIEPPLTLHASVEPPREAAHQTEQRRTTLAESPVAVTDLAVGNRMLRAAFWRRSGLAFTEAGDVDFALAAYQRADAFDLLTDPVYIPTGRREGFSVGSVPDVLSRLGAWLDDHDRTRRLVAALDIPDVLDWWLWGVLDSAIQPFLGDIERATDEQWALLRDHVRRLVDAGGEAAWASLRADSRIKLWLVLHDRRTELEEYVERRLFEREHRPTVVRDGRILAQLPFHDDAAIGIPASDFEMGERETPLRVGLQGIRWERPERLELRVFARIEHVSLDEQPAVEAWLVGPGGARLALTVEPHPDPMANMVEGSRYQDYRLGSVRLVADVAELARRAVDAGGTQRWRLEIEMTVADVTRRGRVTDIDDRASAGMIETGHLGDRQLEGALVGLRGRSAGRFAVVARPTRDAPELVSAEVEGATVRLRLRPGSDPVRAVRLAAPGLPVVRGRTAGAPGPDGVVEAVVDVPRRPLADDPRRFVLHAVTPQGEPPVTWPGSAPQWLASGTGEVVLSRSDRGTVEVADAVMTLVVEDVRHVDGAFEVDARWLGVAPSQHRIVLQSPRGEVVGELVEQSGAQLRLRFASTWDEWGLGRAPLPADRYWFALDCGRFRGVVLLGEDILDRLLQFATDETFRYRPIRMGRQAGLLIAAPVVDDDRGPYAQTRLQQWFRDCDLPVDPDAVYLQSYAGASATDSQLAIHHELRRTHPEKTLYWGVADAASVVPEGGVPVLMQSREWYRVMATAGQLCMNIDPERWFSLRPGQRLLQTFHGYPAKSMGIRMWEAKGYTPRRVALELDRTSADWSMILTPAPEMDEHYRREYRYDGPIHSEGYPRDDVLVSPLAAQIREETRARLGIAPQQKAVLYAPTWRDDLATNWRRAEAVHHLDVAAASRRLGSDYVLLMRGHRFHAPSEGSREGAQLIDVTSYPEINDLILASDAAVLDYSSLRFDFALTGRPMIFLVPDLSTYTGGVRGFLYPFEESAPGPLVDTADEVVELLRDLGGLEERYAAAQATFHQRFNYLQDGHSAEKVVRAFFG